MQTGFGSLRRTLGSVAAAASLVVLWASTGCGSLSMDGLNLLLTAPFTAQGNTNSGTGTGTGGSGAGGFFDSTGRGTTDPCAQSLAKKFVRISMKNLDSDDHIHYFVAFIAFVQSTTYPDGGVCADDISLYTSFGYTPIAEGATTPFGNYCIAGPALVYFHQNGAFRRGTGTGSSSLGAAIGPAQGSNATFDNFFTSSGVQVPVPDVILWHNPGTGAGASLQIGRIDPSPCSPGTVLISTPECEMDSFYYVDESDLLAGSTALGTGSGRRVPNEIQGTSCECAGFGSLTQAAQQLAPANASGSQVRCNEFVRGGRIEFAFIRQDDNPPIPQLLWKVQDASLGTVHEFDSRANIP